MEVFLLNKFYPISLNLKDRLCIVVGGGSVAARRIHKLLESGAMVRIIAPDIVPTLQKLLESNSSLSWFQAKYKGKEDLTAAYLVFAATDDGYLNEQIALDANSLNIFTNIASNGILSDFIVPASFNQGDLQVSLSTSTKVPGLSKAISKDLENLLGPEYSALIKLLEQIRILVIDSPNKEENLNRFSLITNNYQDILDKLYAGISIDDIYKDLILQLSLEN